MLLGRAAKLAFVYFNTRVLARAAEEPSADDFKELFEWLDSTEETATSVVEAEAADQLATAAAEELVDEETIEKIMGKLGAWRRGMVHWGFGKHQIILYLYFVILYCTVQNLFVTV